VEKAHPEVMNLFYQLFDKGVLTDGEGRDIDFRNTVIFLTSNLGSETIARACEAEPAMDLDALVALVHDELTAHFRSALLARMEVVPYRAIARDVLREIVLQKLARVTERLRENRGLALEFGDEVADYVLERCTVAEAGARNVEAVINRQVLPPMARDLLTSMEADHEPRRCRVEVREGRVTADLEG
jgi:type VI secretion system protein VasG